MKRTSSICGSIFSWLVVVGGCADMDEVGSSAGAISLEEAVRAGVVRVHDRPIDPLGDFEFDEDFIRNNGKGEALVWQGFEHSWGYNHRLNRLGDSVLSFGCDSDDPSECRGFVEHTASSGSGSDQATYTSHFTRVVSNTDDVRFLNGELELEIRGEERETIDIRDTFTLELGPRMAGYDSYTVVLNGFDLFAIPSLDTEVVSADKLIELELGLFNEVHHSPENILDFDVEVDFMGSCRSAECAVLSRRLNYGLKVRFLVIASRNDAETGLPAANEIAVAPITASDEWSEDREIFAFPDQFFVDGVREAYREAFVAIKRLAIALDDEHHLLQLDTFVDRVSYDQERGRVGFDATLFFKQWRPLMEYANAFGCELLGAPCSRYAYRDSGAYEIRANLRVYQLLDACALEGVASGDFVYLVDEGEVDREQQLIQFGPVCGSTGGEPRPEDPIELFPIDRDDLIDITDLPDVIVADPLEDVRP